MPARDWPAAFARNQTRALLDTFLNVLLDAMALCSETSGPSFVAGSNGSPSVSFAAVPDASSSTSFSRWRGTTSRVHAEHVWPEFSIALFTPVGIALSSGASSSTMKADLPQAPVSLSVIVSAASATRAGRPGRTR